MDSKFGNYTEEEIECFYKKISKNVRDLREAKKLSQMEIAHEIGIKSIAFYSNCESNRYGKHFNIEHLYKISKVLGVDVCEFFAR